MNKIKNIISENFKKAKDNLLKEERRLPSIESIASLPSVYKMIEPRHLAGFLDMGFQRSLAGNNGEMYGPGVYASLKMGGRTGASRLTNYGSVMLQGKMLGGFKNFVMFDADMYPEIRYQIEKYYGRKKDGTLPSIEEQIFQITNDAELSKKLARYGTNMNSRYNGEIIRELRRSGIRGMIYNYSGGPTVLPFDFSSVIIYGYAENVHYCEDGDSIKHRIKVSLDNDAMERYSRACDWSFQLRGYYDAFDENSAVKTRIDNELYCIVQSYSRGYNIAKVDTDNYINPHPKEISNIWLRQRPSTPSIKTGVYTFYYGGYNWNACVCLPETKTPALWYPEDINMLNSPDITDTNNWIELNESQLNEALADLKEQLSQRKLGQVMESAKKALRKHINEEITDKTEQEFVSSHRCYVYRATAPSNFKSIFSNGQLRQFAGSNDGSWYGEGVYAVINPKDVQYSKYDKETHRGGVKMIVLGGFNRFLIFEDKWASKVYGPNHQIKDQVYKLFPKEVADDVWNDMSMWMNKQWGNCQNTMFANGMGQRTTGMLHVIFDNAHIKAKYTNLFSKYNVRGAIYVGGNDGLSMVCWNFDQVIPYQYTTDAGYTWNSDLFNFQEAKERSFRNNDPVQKFRHLYKKISDNIVYCNVGGTKVNVTTVITNTNKYNIININTKNGQKISPFDFDAEPQIGVRGDFTFIYKGKQFKGIVLLPDANAPAFWFPEDMERLNERPNINSTEDWVGFDSLDEAREMLG